MEKMMPRHYRYGEVEAALAETFKVNPQDLGAFRGRLRHLRNIGIPELPRPGSGKQIRYSREAAIEILLALEFSALGLPPGHFVSVAKSLVKVFASEQGEDPRHPDGIVVTEEHPFMVIGNTILIHDEKPVVLGKHSWSTQNIRQWFNFISNSEWGIPQRFMVINVARSVAVLDEALLRSTEAKNT
jgi:hypothetical protein